MLSSVLNSKRAIQVNIAIMRVFVRLRKIMLGNKDLALKFEKLERTVEKQGEQIHAIFEIVKQFMTVEEKPKRRFGFHPDSVFRTDGMDATNTKPIYPIPPTTEDLKARLRTLLQFENANPYRLIDIYGSGNTGSFDENNFVLCISDNGGGFNVENVLGKNEDAFKMGLTTLGELVHMLRGNLKIISELSKGTSLIIKLPNNENKIKISGGV